MALSGNNTNPLAPRALDFFDQAHRHMVLFYLDEDFLQSMLCAFFLRALNRKEKIVTLATAAHHDGLLQKLSGYGVDGSRLKNEGIYTSMDADEILSQCMVKDNIDFQRLNLLIGGTIGEENQASKAVTRGVAVFGELVALLWARREFQALLGLEQFWNKLLDRHSFSLLCGYPIREFEQAGTEGPYLQICNAHSTIIPPDSYPSTETERRIMEATARAYVKQRLHT